MKNSRGFTILDVLLGILVFAVGMLALASLQTNLTRSSVDANTRTVATNIGEEIIERLRSFKRLTTDPNGQVFAFADIDNNYVTTLLDGGGTVTRAGLQYTIDSQVAGYVFNDDQTNVTRTATAVAGDEYDFKLVNLTISWDSSQQFQVDDSTQVSSADAGSGSITLTGVIPAIPSLASAMVAATDDDFLGGILVDYTPGLRPDIVAIALDSGKFKESTTPEPTVIREGEISETWFDVVTYSTARGNVFLRREEFLVVGCVCNDIQRSNGQEAGFLPAIWNGKEYAIWNGTQNAEGAGTELDMVSKPSGQSASNTQSAFCTTCCRDHHDSSTYSNADYRFNPQLPASERAGDGNHNHWRRGKDGIWEEVGYGEKGPKDDYLESCRMVRKDGFMRVAQDFRQEGIVAFPAGYLDTLAGAEQYSNYVTTALDDFYTVGGGSLAGPEGYPFPGTETDPGELPFLGSLPSQQLRSRGIYVDHIGAEADALIQCIRRESDGYDPDADPDGPTPGDICGAPGVQDYLEVLPFFEVQTTFLSDWAEDPPGNPVTVSSLEITAQDPIPDRGVALLVDASADGQSVTALTEMNRGNVGIAAVNPIRPSDSKLDMPDAVNASQVFIDVNGGPVDGEDPATPALYYWSAAFVSSVGGVNTSSVSVSPSDCGDPQACNTYCARTSETLSCTRPRGAGGGSVVLSGYYKNAGTDLWICASGAAGLSVSNANPSAAVKTATITWDNDRNISGVTLTIQSSSCQ